MLGVAISIMCGYVVVFGLSSSGSSWKIIMISVSLMSSELT